MYFCTLIGIISPVSFIQLMNCKSYLTNVVIISKSTNCLTDTNSSY